MLITTRFPEGAGHGHLAFFVQQSLFGFALGAYPLWKRWRLPPLYQSGVRWTLEPGHGSGVEDFALPIDTYKRRAGDCDDLVIWFLCQDWAQRKLHPLQVMLAGARNRCAMPRVIWQGGELHALVRMPNGDEEDPSRKLGG